MKKKVTLLVVALLLAAPVIVNAKTQDKLVIAISTGFQPFTCLNAEGKPAGMFVDIWRLWAQKTGRRIEFIASNWKTSLENLKNQKADIHSGLLYPQPKPLDWMSGSRSFYEAGVTLFYPLKHGKISDIKELAGQTVAANRGSHPESFLKKNYPDIRILSCNTREELAKASQEGKSKAFIIILPVGKSVIDRLGLSGDFATYGRLLYNEKFHAGVLKKNKELLALVDQGFNAMSRQELADIEARWIPDPASRYYKPSNIIQLTPAEKAWLRSHKTIRVGISPVAPPLIFSDKGVIKGIVSDHLNLLSEYTGIQFDYVICDFADVDAKVKSGGIDMFFSFIIPERLAHTKFTEPFMEFKQVIVARNDAPFMSGIESLKGKKMATLKESKVYERLLLPHPEIEVVPVNTQEKMFKAVAESKADALLTQTYLAGYLLPAYPNLKIAGVADLPPEAYVYAVRKDYPELVGILNNAIGSIPRDRINAIVQKWFHIRVEYRPNWSEMLKWVIVIVGVFTLILGLSLFWNRRLAREIAERRQTEEALQKSERKYRNIFENALVGIYRTSPEGRLLEANDTFARMMGYDSSEEVLAGVTNIGEQHYANPEDRVRLAQLLAEHGKVEGAEIKFKKRDGQVLIVLSSPRIVRDEEGKILYFEGALIDITDRKLAEEKIKASLLEKETLLKEIHHRVKNNLQVISSLLGFQSSYISDESTRKIFEESQYRIRAMAQIHTMLYQSADLTFVDFGGFIRDLASRLQQSYEEAGSPIEINTDIADVSLNIDTSIPCGLILNELIANALKHAFPKGSKGRIAIGMKCEESGCFLKIQDNGIGFPASIDFRNTHSLGLQLVNLLVAQIGGRIDLTVDGGTIWTITFPLKKAREWRKG